MSSPNVVPKKVMEGIITDHGSDTRNWNQELQDLFDPSIAARQLNPPVSGHIALRKNTSMHYHWAADKCGQNADHSRVEEMRAIGWDFASTDDVEMANDFTVRNRRGGKPDGFSNEIRNGDLRLMKIPLQRWREKRKAENVAAFQMAYPQAYGATGVPMSSANLIPGMKSELVTGEGLGAFERNFDQAKPAAMIMPKET